MSDMNTPHNGGGQWSVGNAGEPLASSAAGLRRPPDLPAPEVPKRKTPGFLWLMIGFAALVMIGLIIGFARMANVPQPAVDAPTGDTPSGAIPASDDR
ncbi:MAG TPA: hypothetical protein VER33_06025 [Polyangiaceae bacterium]|nr:hypothetical protein [Polyangiaceae bacterium]